MRGRLRSGLFGMDLGLQAQACSGGVAVLKRRGHSRHARPDISATNKALGREGCSPQMRQLLEGNRPTPKKKREGSLSRLHPNLEGYTLWSPPQPCQRKKLGGGGTAVWTGFWP